MSSARHTLHVCTTCRPPGTDPAAPRDGAKLFGLVEALYRTWDQRSLVRLNPVECMSGCDRACTVAVSGTAKPSYLFGDKQPTDETARAALDLAARYLASETGVLPRKDRPAAFRSGILANIPG